MAAFRELSQAQKIPKLSLSLGLKKFVAQMGLVELKCGAGQSRTSTHPRGSAEHPRMPILGSSIPAGSGELCRAFPVASHGESLVRAAGLGRGRLCTFLVPSQTRESSC